MLFSNFTIAFLTSSAAVLIEIAAQPAPASLPAVPLWKRSITLLACDLLVAFTFWPMTSHASVE